MSTNKFAVLGSPVDHSKSPLLHNRAYQHLGIEGTYTRSQVNQGELANFMDRQGQDYDAFSITMPLKEEAYAYAKIHDELSSRIRVANTLRFNDGYWISSNTDVLGFQELFKRKFAAFLGKPIILGSGSTARSATLALELQGVTSLQIMARSESAVKTIQGLFPNLEITYSRWGGLVEDVSLVISAVPEVQGVTFAKSVSQFMDVTYRDSEPKILQSISANAFTYVNGHHLLVYQAAYQVLQMRGIGDNKFDEIVSAMFKALGELN